MADTAADEPVVNSMKRYAYVIAVLLLKLLAARETFLIAEETVSPFVQSKDTPG